MGQARWFVCTKDFVCNKCGKENSIMLPLKASNSPDHTLIESFLMNQRLRCENQECREPLSSTGAWEIEEATASQAEVFESNSKSLRVQGDPKHQNS